MDPFMVHGGFSSQLLVDASKIRRENQLRLVVYLTIYNVFFTSQVVIAGCRNHKEHVSFRGGIDC